MNTPWGQELKQLRLKQKYLSQELAKWQRELWYCHGDSSGESWDHVMVTIDRLQGELDQLQRIVERRLTETQSVIFGD